jgi:hypothetical protein
MRSPTCSRTNCTQCTAGLGYEKQVIILLCKYFTRYLYLFACLSRIGIQAYKAQVLDTSLGATTRRVANTRLTDWPQLDRAGLNLLGKNASIIAGLPCIGQKKGTTPSAATRSVVEGRSCCERAP